MIEGEAQLAQLLVEKLELGIPSIYLLDYQTYGIFIPSLEWKALFISPGKMEVWL